MDEYNELEKIFFNKIKIENEAKLVKSKGLYEYVNLLNPPKQIPPQVSYRLLLELCRIFKEDRISRINKKLIDYNAIKETSPDIDKLIEMAGNFADEFDISDDIEIEIDSKTKKHYELLHSHLYFYLYLLNSFVCFNLRNPILQ